MEHNIIPDVKIYIIAGKSEGESFPVVIDLSKGNYK